MALQSACVPSNSLSLASGLNQTRWAKEVPHNNPEESYLLSKHKTCWFLDTVGHKVSKHRET